jgi:hypothetical protein
MKFKIVYEAIFVTNPEKLQRAFPPVHTNVFYHHMTIAFKPEELSMPDKIGMFCTLKIIGRLTTDKIDALLIETSYTEKKFPHITLSTADDIPPGDSNLAFIANRKAIVHFQRPKSVVGTYGFFTGLKEIADLQYRHKGLEI